MNLLRPVLALALVLGACILSARFTAHHTIDDPFVALYSHLVPAPLVSPAPHGTDHAADSATGHAAAEPHYLVQLPADWAPAAFDANPAREGTQLVLTNLQIFQLCAVLLIFVCFSGVPKYLRTGQGDATSKLFAGFALWVRDEMVYPAMGRETGKKLLPYFLSLFFFVMFMNLLGLVPGSATATASIFVTAGLAITTLVMMVIGGMIVQGPVAYWKHLVPHVPIALLPLMIPLELLGLVVKPFALTVRLFANMTGGHMVVLSFMGLLFFMARGAGEMAAYATSPLVVGFAVFIMIIESFVALLQAYVFTMLSIMFIQASFHPDH
ncbi:MAG: F0F1 ATP synthase subunit A [Planctomycetes bacterium]|nr:F0F1 ATP synthase subunit A [Planctomycetota bacterium]